MSGTPRSFRWRRWLAVFAGLLVLSIVALGTLAVRRVNDRALRAHIECDLYGMLCAADQFYIQTGKTSATYDDIVGPGKWISKYPPEYEVHYRTLAFKAGEGISLKMPDGRVYSAKLKR